METRDLEIRDQRYIMALDQGTTSSRCIIYDRKGNIISSAQKEFEQIFPNSGWVEHDPEKIWESQLEVIRVAMDKVGFTANEIASIGITNQRETTIVWEKETGRPVYNAIVWQCRRTAAYCDSLKEKGLEDRWRMKTGLPLDPYFSGTKLKWILDNVEGARKRAKEGELLFGTVDTWLLWNLTGGKVHATDVSNASRTMMFNIRDLCWDDEILEELDIPRCMLPEVEASSHVFGNTDPELFDGEIHIGGIAGDQQAALFGQTCFKEGMAKNTFGTGGFLLINTGENIVASTHGLIETIAWKIGDKVTYALEGSIFSSGATIQWLRDELRFIDSAPEAEEICRSVPDTGGVYLVPAFTGLGAPYWDPYARGILAGLTRGTGRAHIVRAAVEAMAYQTCDILEAAAADMADHDMATSEKLQLRVDGGAAANDFLLEFQADMSGRSVCRPKSIETTSLGAAYLAGLAVGYWRDLEDIVSDWQIDCVFDPEAGDDDRKKKLAMWRRAVERARDWE